VRETAARYSKSTASAPRSWGKIRQYNQTEHQSIFARRCSGTWVERQERMIVSWKLLTSEFLRSQDITINNYLQFVTLFGPGTHVHRKNTVVLIALAN